MYYIAFAFVKLVSLLPFPVIYLLSDFTYLIVYKVAKYRKKVVRDNLFYSFPEKSETELRKIERDFYHHFCDLIFESFKLLGMNEKQINKRMVYRNYQDAVNHYNENRSIILQNSHFGNWEWTSSFSLNLPKDKPVYQVYKQQTSEVSDKIIFKIRSHFGARNIEMKSLLREMVNMKKEGRLGMFGMVSDQSPRRDSIHYYTQFLNQHTAVITGAEQLAKKFDFPVYYVKVAKPRRGHYECELVLISDNPKAEAPFEISEKYMRMLEEDIRKNPAIWLWSHKRWKYTRNT